MQSSSESSIWRSLAVAFGDGLAFGVGVKLSQNAARQKSALPHPETEGLADRLSQVEETVQRIARTPVVVAGAADPKSGMDQKVLEVIVAALEARLKEQAGLVDRRLADLDAKITLELKSLDEQDRLTAQQAAQDLNSLKEQMVSLNREFGEAVGRIVAEQVAAHVSSQVEARAADLERLLDGRIRISVEALLEQRISRAVAAGLEPVAAQMASQVASQVEARS
ncbi:MAG TPA: hypothetical protein VGH38_12915, partial [Bryobacteraceae bacterium]